MSKKYLRRLILLAAMSVVVIFSFTACGDKQEEETQTEATAEPEVEQDFIVVGANEDGTPLIFYNLNMVSSVEELEEYVDLSYDFEKKPELLVAQVEAPEGVFEQILEMLNEKGVVYTMIEDEE